MNKYNKHWTYKIEDINIEHASSIGKQGFPVMVLQPLMKNIKTDRKL